MFEGALNELNFDGLVGPTHNYGGLSPGNVASMSHGGRASSPKMAALQGLAKMRLVASLGVGQAVLPPQPRPSLTFLRGLGYRGSDADVIAAAASEDDQLLRIASSAAAMWTANAATVGPSVDSEDGRLHFVPANLHAMLHRSIEAEPTFAVLKAIFADPERFAVHPPLPGGGQLSDEGAANHTRLSVEGRPAVHVFGWGRTLTAAVEGPQRFPARQTLEASRAVARSLALDPAHLVFAQQDPAGIDAGGFHTDVLAVGAGPLLLLHERAFADCEALLASLTERLGESFRYVLATEDELATIDAVRAYPFNSQLLTLPSGDMVIIAPEDSRVLEGPRRFLERVVAENVGVTGIHYLDLRQSMNNGGGPACLRLRVPMTAADRAAVRARVFVDDELLSDLESWVERNYRDALRPSDLADPDLWVEVMTALDELTRILEIGSVFEFQR